MLLSVLLRPFLGRRLSLCWFALAAGWLPAALGVAADSAVAASAAAAVTARVTELGGRLATAADGSPTGITISDGSGVTADDLRLFGDLPGLQAVSILNCRTIDDAALEALGTRLPLRTLGITNSAVTDAGAAWIAASFPELEELDLSSNTNLTGAAMKSIASLGSLKRLLVGG